MNEFIKSPLEFTSTFQLFIENINDLICVIDYFYEFKFELINESVFYNILGYLNKDLIGNSFLDIVHLDDAKKTIKGLKRTTDISKYIKEIRIRHKNGNYIWFEVKYKKFKDEKSQKKILLIFKNISEFKLLEKKITELEERFEKLTVNIPEIRFWKIFTPKKYEEALRSSFEMLQMVIESIPEYIFWKDINSDYLGCNKNYAKLLDLKNPDYMVGKNDNDLIGKKNSMNQFNKKEKLIMNMGKPEFHSLESWILKNEEQIWLDVNRIPLKDSTGKVVGILVTYEDITERKKAEEKIVESEKKIREQNIELKKLDQLKSDFLTIAAHELKTPLVSVSGYVDLILMRDSSLNSETIEFLKTVIRNVNRLNGHINRLMDVMKIEAKKIKLNLKRENIHEIFSNCIKELQFQIKEKDLKIYLNVDKDLNLSLDSFRISQVFSNLLSNAVKFTSKPGKIEISAKKEQNNYLFKIKDDGKGLTQQELQKIFVKFVKIDLDPDTYSIFESGSGLGLYISKSIIDLHGGKIWAESEGKNKGSTFIFSLPIRKDFNP